MGNIIEATEDKRLDAITAYTSTVLGHLAGDVLDAALAGEVKRYGRNDAAFRAHALASVHPDDLIATLVKRGHTLASVGIASLQIDLPTTKTNVINPAVSVRTFEVMADASGAPAALTYNGYTFAFDFLGEMKLTLIGGTGSRTASKVARDVCTHAYLTLLETRVDDTWRARNVQMYDESLPGA